MHTEEVLIKDIKPYKKNAKKHDKTQIDNVAESIRQFGFAQPLVIDKDNVLIIGHCRLLAAKKLKLKEVPCVRMDELTEEQVAKLRLLDNKLNESDWDFELLQEEVDGLDFDGFDLDWGGYSDIEDSEVVEDEPPEVETQEPPVAQYGDIWLLGDHRLMCGDSTKSEDVDRLVDGEEVSLFLTDPPYNVNYEGTAGKIANDNMQDSAFRQFLTDAFRNANDHMKSGSAFYIWHADSEGYNFRGACIDVGWQIRQCLIWVKNSLVMGRQDYQWQHEPCLYGGKDEVYDPEHEPCLYGWKKGASHEWHAGRKQTTILEYDKPKKNDVHPTMKPVNLMSYLVRNSSQKGAIVLDLFGGSGSTLMACEQLDRVCYTMEYDPRFVDVIVKRWEKFTGKKAVRLNGHENA